MNSLINTISYCSVILGLICCSATVLPQTILTEQDVVTAALKKSPALQAAALQVTQQKQLEGASFNLPNPDVLFESPTGEFITTGISQSFQFPTVYKIQCELAKQKTALSEKEMVITEAEISLQVKTAYLNLQFAHETLKQLKKQDSIYYSIANAAKRQFTAGQIDFVAQTYAATQYGQAHNRFVQAQTDALLAMQQLQLFTGITDSFATTPFSKNNIAALMPLAVLPDSAAISNNPLIQYHVQTQFLADKSLQSERSKALPGFSFGYMNQGPKNTPFPLRFRAGIQIPVWFWQYGAAVKAAKTNLQITRQNMLTQQQELNAQLQQTAANAAKYQSSIAYYENTALKQATDLITASGRLFNAGQTDYITYLRTISDAYQIELQYLETVYHFNLSIINFNYLIGQK